MKATSEKPNQNGWYWYKDARYILVWEPVFVEQDLETGDFEITSGCSERWGEIIDVEILDDSLWCGPIPYPED